MNILRRTLVILSLLALNACTGVIFHPIQPHLLTPQQLNLHSEDVYFSSGTLRLHGWWLHATGEPRGTIVFVHGNAENISTHIGSVFWLPAHGYDVFLFDYRGYGKSQGTPMLAGVHDDFHAALDYVYTRPGIDTNRIVVFGQSLGAAISVVGLAESPYKERVNGLVVEGTFSSYRGIAREKLAGSWLTWLFQWPLSWTINNDYKPLDAIARIAPTPLLIVHSTNDEIIPFHHAQRLYDAAREPKQLMRVEGVRHIHAFTQAQYQQKLLGWLEQVVR